MVVYAKPDPLFQMETKGQVSIFFLIRTKGILCSSDNTLPYFIQ